MWADYEEFRNGYVSQKSNPIGRPLSFSTALLQKLHQSKSPIFFSREGGNGFPVDFFPEEVPLLLLKVGCLWGFSIVFVSSLLGGNLSQILEVILLK